MGRLFIIMEIIFLLLTTVTKRLTTSMCFILDGRIVSWLWGTAVICRA